jgi:hypothetical protein
VQTTARYAHLAVDPVKAAANVVANGISTALSQCIGGSTPAYVSQSRCSSVSMQDEWLIVTRRR